MYGAGGAGTLVALGAALWLSLTEHGRYFLARMLPFTPLFSRLTKSSALEHPTREALAEWVRHNPGYSLADAQRALGVSRGALVHHVRHLERQGFVRTKRRGYRVRMWPAGPPPPPGPYLTGEQKRLVEAVTEAPGITQAGLARRVAMDRKLVAYHVGRLERDGVVRTERAGRTLRHFAKTGGAGAKP